MVEIQYIEVRAVNNQKKKCNPEVKLSTRVIFSKLFIVF